MKVVMASDCAKRLGCELKGPDKRIDSFSDVQDPRRTAVCFYSGADFDCNRFNVGKIGLLLARRVMNFPSSLTYVIVEDPRRAFVELQHFILGDHLHAAESRISRFADVAATARIGMHCDIGSHCVIGDNAVVGDNTRLSAGVVIGPNVVVGSNVTIKANSVIGLKGFGYVSERGSANLEFIHLGSVKIGNDVEIGALNTICAGSIGDTEIGDDVKIDDQVHIAHNVKIGTRTLICAATEISGSVRIGSDCFVGPRVSFASSTAIGDDVFVGVGSVVTKKFGSHIRLVGFPARSLKKED